MNNPKLLLIIASLLLAPPVFAQEPGPPALAGESAGQRTGEGRQPDKPENEVNVPLQAAAQFQPLVSAMRPGDGIRAAYVRDGGLDSVDGINHVKSLEWQSKSVARAARWLSLIGATRLRSRMLRQCHRGRWYGQRVTASTRLSRRWAVPRTPKEFRPTLAPVQRK